MMKFHWGMFCVLGMAACSTNKPPEQPYTYSSSSQVQVGDPVAATNAPESTSPAATDRPDLLAENSDITSSDRPLVGADGRAQEPQRSEAQRLEAQRIEAQRVEAEHATDHKSKEMRSNDANDTANGTSNNSDATLTAGDQGQSPADLRITQQIRKAVVGDSSLSFSAKNVQIITRNGNVVLRGQVKTTQERSAIEAMARKAAGSGQVNNLLEIKP